MDKDVCKKIREAQDLIKLANELVYLKEEQSVFKTASETLSYINIQYSNDKSCITIGVTHLNNIKDLIKGYFEKQVELKENEVNRMARNKK